MSVSTASFFFAALALCCLGAVALVAIAIAAAAQRLSPSPALAGFREDLGRVAVPLGFVVAATAMAGSLYYSESVGYTPCTLCWYQRICMYPLALILGVATIRRDRGVRFYALPLALIGVCISAYHSYIQAYPPDSGTSFCTADAPCTARHVWQFGFVSIPFMAMSAFLFVITMMLLARPSALQRSTPVDEQAAVPV